MPLPSPDKWIELRHEGHPAQKFCQTYKCVIIMNPYRISRDPYYQRPLGVARQDTCGNHATAEHSKKNRRKRRGKRVKKQRKLWKKRCTIIRVGTYNIGTMTGRGRELEDLMERRNIHILFLKETKWKKIKVRNIGSGCKLIYNGVDGRRNGVGIVVRKEQVESVLKVKRVSDRLMAMKLEVKVSILNIVSAYAPRLRTA